MGELADFTTDNGILSDLLDDNEEDDGPAAISCRYCGKGGLYWYQENGRWRLIEHADSPNWKFHACNQHPSRKR